MSRFTQDSHSIKRNINRLVEYHRYQRKKKPTPPSNRPGIKGAVGIGDRVPVNDDPAT